MTNRGGKRLGAGRPAGTGKFGESTKAIRIPASMVDRVMHFMQYTPLQLPLYGAKISAGFPSPAEDFLESPLDLNEYLVKHPSSTFLVRASGDSMINAGIFPNDILVVDRSLEPVHGKIVIAVINNELTVKRLYKSGRKIQLLPENDQYPPILLNPEDELVIWGVVAHVLHAV